jgi:hypothetical protein
MRAANSEARAEVNTLILKGLRQAITPFLDLPRIASYHAFRGIFRGFFKFLDFPPFRVGTVL